MTRAAPFFIAAGLLIASCGSDASPAASDDGGVEDVVDPATTAESAETAVPDPADIDDEELDAETSVTDADSGTDVETSAEPGAAWSFQIDVWADNWSAVYVDGELVGEDSVPITTERSFNAETFAFDASLPFTIAIEAKDFKETDSGIEYIGEGNQQMGDGGIIAQVTDLSTGEVIAVTDADWTSLVVHQAPLNTECERDPDPDATCEFSIIDTPTDWTSVDFDDGDWSNATVWSEADVDPKDGYDEVTWDQNAQLIWGADLEVDNTVLLRTTVS